LFECVNNVINCRVGKLKVDKSSADDNYEKEKTYRINNNSAYVENHVNSLEQTLQKPNQKESDKAEYVKVCNLSDKQTVQNQFERKQKRKRHKRPNYGIKNIRNKHARFYEKRTEFDNRNVKKNE